MRRISRISLFACGKRIRRLSGNRCARAGYACGVYFGDKQRKRDKISERISLCRDEKQIQFVSPQKVSRQDNRIYRCTARKRRWLGGVHGRGEASFRRICGCAQGNRQTRIYLSRGDGAPLCAWTQRGKNRRRDGTSARHGALASFFCTHANKGGAEKHGKIFKSKL